MKCLLLVASMFLYATTIAQGSKGVSDFKNIEFNNQTQIVEKSLPPLLELSGVVFQDANQNNRLDANETASINFYIVNKGKGMAKNLKINTANGTPLITGFSWDQTKTVALIPAGDSAKVAINLQSTLDLKTGALMLNLTFSEMSGFAPDPFNIDFQTKEFSKPNIEVVDHLLRTDKGYMVKKQNTILQVLVQNTGQGVAENVKVSFDLPGLGAEALGENNFLFTKLNPSESKEINFEFILSDKYIANSVPIKISISEKYGRFAQGKTIDIVVNSKTEGTGPVSVKPKDAKESENDNQGSGATASLTSDVDKDIPVNSVKNQNKFALIIGNEHYSDKVLNSQIKDVMFANVDATVFKAYCEKTLGLPTENIQFILDADLVKMNLEITLLSEKIKRKNGQAEIIFYYSGHGSPDEKSKSPFLVPVGLEVSEISQGINVSSLYKTLSQSNAKRTTVFLDACFTGISETAKFITPTTPVIPNEGKIVVFAATGVSQAAEPYTEKKHGMFTYFLLKKLKETKGNISYQELDEYLKSEVGITSLNVNRKAQDPQTEFSKDLNENWKNWKVYE